jgi:hypothetical protein
MLATAVAIAAISPRQNTPNFRFFIEKLPCPAEAATAAKADINSL